MDQFNVDRSARGSLLSLAIVLRGAVEPRTSPLTVGDDRLAASLWLANSRTYGERTAPRA